MAKVCTKCNEEKDLSEFYKDSRKEGRRVARCRACCRVEKVGYRSQNPDKIKAANTAQYEKNKEELKTKQRAYSELNREKVNQRSNDYYQANKENCKANAKEHRVNNKEYYANYMAQYRSKNKAAILEHCRRRRAAKLERVPSWLTKDHIEQMRSDFFFY